VGAVVGGVGGAIIGGISDETRARFRTYVTQEKRSSYTHDRDVVIGAELGGGRSFGGTLRPVKTL
jgi:hypothetical protein